MPVFSGRMPGGAASRHPLRDRTCPGGSSWVEYQRNSRPAPGAGAGVSTPGFPGWKASVPVRVRSMAHCWVLRQQDRFPVPSFPPLGGGGAGDGSLFRCPGSCRCARCPSP
jgi:hypothetical protein